MLVNSYENIEYPPNILQMLAEPVKGSIYEVFRFIWNHRENGCTKVQLAEETKISRRRYDDAILILEAAQFIYSTEDGRSIRYFPTVRGRQLAGYLKTKGGSDYEND